MFFNGGMGATPVKDGESATSWPSNISSTPVEVAERNSPLFFHHKRLRPGSGGAGRFRGGLGLEKVFEATTADVTVSHRGERFASSPWPLEGGSAGTRAHAFILRSDGTREDLPSKKMIVLHPGDQLWEYIAGGAGHGDPLDRNPAAVLADVLDGKIASPAEYGVVLTPDGAAVDEVKTKEGRAALAGRRGAAAGP